MGVGEWKAWDRKQLDAHGVAVDEVDRWRSRLRGATRWAAIERPATLGDGIEAIDPAEHDELCATHAEAASAGRFSKFVPASGAATRMFRELLHYQRGPGRGATWDAIRAEADRDVAEARAVIAFAAALPDLALELPLREAPALLGVGIEQALGGVSAMPLLDALLSEAGLALAELPKGLLPFHRQAGGTRTAFEEQIAEAAAYCQDGRGRVRVHFTVSPAHRARVQSLIEQVQARLSAADDFCPSIEISEQKRSTDVLVFDAAGEPLRDAAGALVLRPAGHGALIENLDEMGADLVYIKNIDNVQPAGRRESTVLWKRLLGGLLVRLEREVRWHVRRLQERDPDDRVLAEADRFLRESLHVAATMPDSLDGRESVRARLLHALHRPLRVCGMVRNAGEPGGGPFWIASADRPKALQIVEAAQVDPTDAHRQRLLAGSTHFNPVDLVCAVRDAAGRPFELLRFVDDEASIVTRKVVDGVEQTVLERPGLWNGAMAGWNTIFVEVPLATFTPVKTILDLARPEHR